MQLLLLLPFLANFGRISRFRSSTPSTSFNRSRVFFFFWRTNNLVDIQFYLRLGLGLCVLCVQTQLVLVKVDFTCGSAIRGCRFLQRFNFFDSVCSFLGFLLQSDLFFLNFCLLFLFFLSELLISVCVIALISKGTRLVFFEKSTLHSFVLVRVRR